MRLLLLLTGSLSFFELAVLLATQCLGHLQPYVYLTTIYLSFSLQQIAILLLLSTLFNSSSLPCATHSLAVSFRATAYWLQLLIRVLCFILLLVFCWGTIFLDTILCSSVFVAFLLPFWLLLISFFIVLHLCWLVREAANQLCHCCYCTLIVLVILSLSQLLSCICPLLSQAAIHLLLLLLFLWLS